MLAHVQFPSLKHVRTTIFFVLFQQTPNQEIYEIDRLDHPVQILVV